MGCPLDPFDTALPPQYCEFYPDYENCKKWLEEHMPDKFADLHLDDHEEEEGGEDGKKRQKRGGKGMMKAKKKDSEQKEKRILLSIAPRGKRKAVTVVQGLKSCGEAEKRDVSCLLRTPFLTQGSTSRSPPSSSGRSSHVGRPSRGTTRSSSRGTSRTTSSTLYQKSGQK